MAKKKKAEDSKPAKKAAAKPDRSTERGAGQQNPGAFKKSERPAVKKANKQTAKRADVRDVRRGFGDDWSYESPATPTEPTGAWTGYPGPDPQPGDTTVGGGTVPAPGGDNAVVTDPTPVATGPDPARLAMERYVKISGFPLSFVDDIMKARQDGLLDDNSTIEDYIGVAVDNKDFQGRFPAIVNQWNRREAGDMSVQIMTPGQVLEYERTLKNAADDYGLSAWVSSPEQIANLLGNDVSADEALERINQAGYAASVAPPAFREAFFKQYGLTEGNLIGFFLDPNKEEGEIKKAVAQGQIVAAGIQNGFANNWEVGQRLFDRGVSGDQAMSGFATAALMRGLESGLGATVSEGQVVDAAFDDAAAKAQVANVAAQRSGRFNTSGGAAESQKGVSGLGAAAAT